MKLITLPKKKIFKIQKYPEIRLYSICRSKNISF